MEELEPLRRKLVRDGRLRVGINLGNAALAKRDEASGALGGVTVALGDALCHELGCEAEHVVYPGAGKVVADAGNDVWDVAFVAIDPERADRLTYTPAYVLIEAKAMVRDGSDLSRCDELDRDGLKLLVAEGSAYDLYLTAHAKNLELVRAETPPASFEAFIAQDCEADAVAGVVQSLERAFAGRDGFRMLDGRITAVEQAMVLPIAHAELAPSLTAFVEAKKADGFVRRALDESGQRSLQVAPPKD